jgi:dodecin
MSTQLEERTRTSVAKVVEITADSTYSFEDAIQRAIVKASESVHGMRSAWVAGQQVRIEDGKVVSYRVDLKVTFVLD